MNSGTPSPAPPPPAKELQTFPCDRQLLSARFSPCGKYLASGAMDRVVLRWNLAEDSLAPLPPLTGANGWVQSIAFHPSRNLLFVSDSWGRLICTEYEGEAPAVQWEHPNAHDGAIRHVAISADGRRLATCGPDARVRVWNAADGTPALEYRHTADVFAVTFAPDGAHLVFGDQFGKLLVLDPATNRIVREFDAGRFYRLSRLQDVAGLRTLTFLNGGLTLAAGGCQPDNGGFLEGSPLLLQFDFAGGRLLSERRIGSAKDGFIRDLVVHPDGFMIAVTGGQPGAGRLLFLRPDDEQPFYTNADLPNCHSVALHPDNRRLVVTSTNRDSNGNGRMLDKDGSYRGNSSPLHLFAIN